MLKKTMLAAGVLAFSQGVQAQSAEQLQKQVDILAQEVESLKQDQESGSGENRPYFGAYGEHHYNNYRSNPSYKDDMVDTHRFVLFMGYDFSDSIRFMSELEVEHAYAGDGEPGAVELEQAYVEFDTSQNTRLKTGMFLLPVGILNETHEPDTFYGVERNELESRIIPSTWWETGAMFTHDLGGGLSYDLAFHSGLEVSGGSSAGTAALSDRYNIRSGRQKSAKATANDGAVTGRIKFNGVDGLEVSASVQQQADIHQSAPDGDPASCSGPDPSDCSLGFAGEVPDANAQLIEVHARYSIANFKLTAQHAAWDIDSDAAEQIGKDEQEATMFEAGYRVLPEVGVFGRHTTVDTTAGSADNNDATEVVTGGVNYWPHPRVVVKADYQDFENDDRPGQEQNRFNLGVGWSF